MRETITLIFICILLYGWNLCLCLAKRNVYVDEKSDWHEAIRLCKIRGYSGILDGASKVTEDELKNVMESKGVKHMWTGIRRVTFHGLQWIGRSKHTDNWASSTYHCGYLDQSGSLETTEACNDTASHVFLCQFQRKCPDGDSKSCVTLGGQSFVLYDRRATWYDARTSCLVADGDLAVLREPSKLPWLQRLLAETKFALWVGARTFDWINWETEDESHPLFGYKWGLGQPDPAFECVLLVLNHSNFYWETRPCQQKHHFVCSSGSGPYSGAKTEKVASHLVAPVLSAALVAAILLVSLVSYTQWRRRRAQQVKGTSRVKYRDLRGEAPSVDC